MLLRGQWQVPGCVLNDGVRHVPETADVDGDAGDPKRGQPSTKCEKEPHCLSFDEERLLAHSKGRRLFL